MTSNISTPVIVVEANDEKTAVVLANQITLSPEPGKGLPPGGIVGQALIKKSDLSYETEWATIDEEKGEEVPTSVSAVAYADYERGNDETNSGESWLAAKKTIQAAVETLPEQGEGLTGIHWVEATKKYENTYKPVRAGTVYLAHGTHKIKSRFIREESLAFSGGAKTIYENPETKEFEKIKGSRWVKITGSYVPSDEDIGKVILNPLMPSKVNEATEIIGWFYGKLIEYHIETPSGKLYGFKRELITPGSGGGSWYYEISEYISKTLSSSQWIVEPGVRLGEGIHVIGAGPTGGVDKSKRVGKSATSVVDVGNTIAIYLGSGSPRVPYEGRILLKDFSLITGERAVEEGKYVEVENSKWGVVVANTFSTHINNLHIRGFTGWGLYIGENAGSELDIQDTIVVECGNTENQLGTGSKESAGVSPAAVTMKITGGIWAGGTTGIGTMLNCEFLNCYGTCALVAGLHCVGCVFNHAQPTVAGKSGINLWSAGAKVTPSTFLGGWMEGGRQEAYCEGGFDTFIGVHFQGIFKKHEELEEEENESWSSSVEYEAGETVEGVGFRKGTIYVAVTNSKGKEPGAEYGIYWAIAEVTWEANTEYFVNQVVWENEAGITKRYLVIRQVPKKIEGNNTHPNIYDKSGAWGEPYYEQGPSAGEYAIEGGACCINCYFGPHSKAHVHVLASSIFSWFNCSTNDKSRQLEREGRCTFIEAFGEENVPMPALYGHGRVGGKEESEGEINIPYYVSVSQAPSNVSMEVAGTEKEPYLKYVNYQNDVRLYVPITFKAGAKVTRTHGREKGTKTTTYGTYEWVEKGSTVLEIYLHFGEEIRLGYETGAITWGAAHAQPA